jgi:hypothetical protein
MLSFGQRFGYEKLPESLAPDAMPDALRNSLWNAVDLWWNDFHAESEFLNRLWWHLWKLPTDSVPSDAGYGNRTYRRAWAEVRAAFFSRDWLYVYAFLEFVLVHFDKFDNLQRGVSYVLKTELAAYRVLNRQFVRITDEQEVVALEEALAQSGEFAHVSSHLSTALGYLSDRVKPDFRNSIKESISAVEATAKIISGEENATLNKALAVLEKKGKLHACLKKGYSALYEYTNDAEGIRHALMDEPNLTEADAKFFLLACTSFVNYLKTLA